MQEQSLEKYSICYRETAWSSLMCSYQSFCYHKSKLHRMHQQTAARCSVSPVCLMTHVFVIRTGKLHLPSSLF